MTDKIQRCRELGDIEHSDATFGKIIDAASEKGRLATQLADDLEVALEALDKIANGVDIAMSGKAGAANGESWFWGEDVIEIAQTTLDKIRGKS